MILERAHQNLRIVTTSWDDGHKLDMKLAKLLEKYDIKGTFYISPFFFEDCLTKAEIKALDGHHEIGAHTLTHSDLTSISLDKVEKEIKGSKQYLEEVLGHEIYMFCYPKGRYNSKIKKIVKECGFCGARTCAGGHLEFPNDPFELGVTLCASNGSPLMTLKIYVKTKISLKSLLDWELRAKLLFDKFLDRGGIYHLWGHSWEIDKNNNWSKLERVLQYISNRPAIEYKTNGEILNRCAKK